MSAEFESNATFDEKDIISIASLDSLIITNRPKETSRRSSRGALATTAGKRKLLKFQQLNFTGSYPERISFKYLFGASVDSNTHITTSEKLKYFRVCLKGDAKKMISSVMITNAIFGNALTLLQESFETNAAL